MNLVPRRRSLAASLALLPLLAACGGLLPKPGRQIRYRKGTPLSNLWLTLAQMVGVERKEFGRSTGTLTDLG